MTSSAEDWGEEVQDVRIKKLYKCSECGKSFRKKASHSQHMAKTHKTKVPHNCGLCGKQFSSLSGMRQHITKNHSQPLMHLQCDICNKVMATAIGFKLHLYKAHNRQKPYQCNYCPKTFFKQEHLNCHEENFHGNLPCSVCGKIFSLKSSLMRHEKCHTATSVYCEICGKRFLNADRLRGHQISHTDIKPHICTYCGKSYRQRQALRIHEISHTGGDKPFKCNYCCKTFQ